VEGALPGGGDMTSPLTSPRPRYRRFNAVYTAHSPAAPGSAPEHLRAGSDSPAKSPEPHLLARAAGRITPGDREALRLQAQRWSAALGEDSDLSDQVNMGT
jgi:hypothetical protein